MMTPTETIHAIYQRALRGIRSELGILPGTELRPERLREVARQLVADGAREAMDSISQQIRGLDPITDADAVRAGADAIAVLGALLPSR
jgi:hypothetical protein